MNICDDIPVLFILGINAVSSSVDFSLFISRLGNCLVNAQSVWWKFLEIEACLALM